jgi:hypothetical protein
MKTINIIDVGCDRYTIKSDCYCLGRQWDNKAEAIKVVRPARETGNVCTMIVSADGEVIDHIDIKDEPKLITNVLSRHLNVEISFTFTNESDYVKNSEIKSFYFAEARKPEDFVPVEPEQTGKIDVLLGNGFVRAELVNGVIHYFNANGDKVQDLDISKVGGKIDSISVNGVPQVVDGNKNVDLKITAEETDPTVPAWAKQPKKPTYNYSEITDKPTLFSGNYNDLTNKPTYSAVATTGSYKDLKDKPTIPSINGLASETYVDNKASTTLQQSKSYTDTKVANLVGSAPSTLDTLSEIATALQNNPNVVNALNNSIATKQNSTDYNLQTNAKTIVGAINEINDRLSSAGTQLQNILGV